MIAEPAPAAAIAAPDEPHAFAPSGRFRDVHTSTGLRRFERCAVCDQVRRFTPHQVARRRAAGLDPRDPRTIDKPASARPAKSGPSVGFPPPTPGPAHQRSETIERYEARHAAESATPVRIEKPEPPWQIRMLAYVLDEALRADLAYTTRILAMDLQRAVRSELHTARAPVVIDEPPRLHHKAKRKDESAPLAHTGDGRAVSRAIKSDRLRKLYIVATAAGWRGRINGAGNVAMASPDGQDRVTFGAADVSKSGYFSARNALRRAGVDVTGL